MSAHLDSALKVIVGLLFLANIASPSALADPYNDGVNLYGQKNYQQAAAKFQQAIKSAPDNSNAYYYFAISEQALGHTDQARSLYQQLLQKFPTSPAAQYVNQAMGASAAKQSNSGQANVHQYSSSQSQASEGASSSGDNLPEHERIYFTPKGTWVGVNCEVNGRQISAILDTGAPRCTFGLEQLKAIGVNPPNTPPDTKSGGIGGKIIPAWNMKVDLRIGRILKHNMPIVVQAEYSAEPLIGQTFLYNYDVTIDKGAGAVEFDLKHNHSVASAGGGGNSVYDVHFGWLGAYPIIQGEIDGHPCKMLFDTGNANGLVMSLAIARQLGISIPQDAQVGTSSGAGGSTASIFFKVRRVKMGPIDVYDAPISVLPQGFPMPMPLFGQEILQGWQYTIDNEHNVLHFVRR